MTQLIPPPGVTTYYNGAVLPPRNPVHSFEATLDTELADEEGRVRRTVRKTTVHLYQPLPGEVASIYDLVIPVVESSDRWHIDLLQKVPLNFDRDNVNPTFLRKVRTLVMNEMYQHLEAEDTTSGWARDAMASPDIASEAVVAALDLRFGPRRVIFDPTDMEANKIAVSQDYTLTPPRAFSKPEWENIRRAAAARPAGQVTPSNRVKVSPDGAPRIP